MPGTPDPTPEHRRDGRYAVRLGLDEVQGVGLEAAERVVAARAERPFVDMADVSRRAELTVAQMESLATAGAFDAFGLSRRQALWNAGYAERTDQLEGTEVQAPPPMLPGMSDVEITTADLWATRISPETHPIEHLRPLLDAEGICSIESLERIEHGTRVRVGGLITHRQRPGTASGVTFLNLEDETGMLNIVCSQSMWAEVPRRRPHLSRHGHPRHARAQRRRDQPGRRQARAHRGRLPAPQPRLPVEPRHRSFIPPTKTQVKASTTDKTRIPCDCLHTSGYFIKIR